MNNLQSATIAAQILIVTAAKILIVTMIPSIAWLPGIE